MDALALCVGVGVFNKPTIGGGLGGSDAQLMDVVLLCVELICSVRQLCLSCKSSRQRSHQPDRHSRCLPSHQLSHTPSQQPHHHPRCEPSRHLSH